MQQPSYLKRGDTIIIISTARKINKEELQYSVRTFESWGLKVEFGKNLFHAHHQFSGTVEERVADLQNALDNDKYQAIICARGGYGTVQLIDHLDFTNFIIQPKWLVGYSDVTVLHNHINQAFGIETLHATMPVNINKDTSKEVLENLKNTLFGHPESISFDLGENSTVVNFDELAPIVGGNLSILYSLTGTTSQVSAKGKFLFIEDLDEYLYHIDRMMMNLKRAGVFEACKGLLVGGMSDMNDNTIPYGKNAEQIILENARELDIPVILGIPSGHIVRNMALIMNRQARVEVKNKVGKITFS